MAALPLAQTDTPANPAPAAAPAGMDNSPDTAAVMQQLRAQQAASAQAQMPQGGAVPTTAPPPATNQQIVNAGTPAPTPSEVTPGAPANQQYLQRNQGVPTQQPGPQSTTVANSEPPAKLPRPMIDPRPYASLAEHNPEMKKLVDDVSAETGASPQRLALTWAQEGGFRTQVPDGKAGEKGPLQIMPSTAAQFDPKGQLDLNDLRGNMTAAGRYINSLDSKFGQDTPSSVGAYQGGEGSVRDIVANPGQAMANHPNTMSRIQQSFPGQQVTPGHFTGAMDMKPQDIMQSAQQGPDGFLKYVAQTAQQSGTTMTDAMRQAEATLVGFMASRGDVGGMQHARDFVLQLAHSGSNEYLQQAHQQMGAGDAAGAAQSLAKAHAFFPDGTMGSFGVDNKGNVWGQRMDEHDPNRALGPQFKVDQQGIQQLFNQTRDPGKFLATVQQEQQSAANTRLAISHGDYYAGLDQERRDIADQKTKALVTVGAGHDNARTDAANTNADARVEAANIRTQARQGTGPLAAASKQADKEAAENFNDVTMPDATPLERGRQAETYHDVRMNGVTAPQAIAVTQGIHDGSLQLVKGKDGRYGVMDPKDKSGQPVAIVSEALGDKLAGGKGPSVAPKGGAIPGAGVQSAGASPVGSAAASPQARATGMGNDLSGTTQPQQAQSSAIPTS